MDYDDLRAKAQAATPGPWVSDGAAVPWTPKQRSPFTEYGASVAVDDETVVVEGGQQDEQGGAVGVLTNEDADFIAAANPQTVLALLDRVEELEAALEAAESVLGCVLDDTAPGYRVFPATRSACKRARCRARSVLGEDTEAGSGS